VSAKPWAEPLAPLDERLLAAEIALANVDTAAERRAIMRELVEAAGQEAARYRALAEQGRTGKQVAAELGVSYQRVLRLLHKSGFFRDKAARREAQAREGVTAVARGETIAAAAARVGLNVTVMRSEVEARFRHDHPFFRREHPPHEHGPCLWCGHPYVIGYAWGGHVPWSRCTARVKAIAAGDEAAMLSHSQCLDRDHGW
jgi:hypothetical protein